MLLHDLVATSTALKTTRSRTRKAALLAELLARLPDDERLVAVTWLSGDLPQGRIGVGWASVYRTEAKPAPEPSLQILGVHRQFSEIQAISGKGSKQARADALHAVLTAATANEHAFLRALLVGELRQGAQLGVMVEGIAVAAQVPPDAVRRALMLSGSAARTAEAAFGGGEVALRAFAVEPFRPLQPMLADTAEATADALARFGGGPGVFEYKLDGARVQVHRAGDRIRVYTRQLHDVTRAVPEVVELVASLSVDRIILDGETLVLGPDGRPLPFQDSMRRFGRKLDVAALRAEMPLSVWFFDCLLLDDDELIDEPLDARLAAMARVLPGDNLIRSVTTDDAEAATAFLRQALRDGHEGVMAKDPGSTYEAGTRGRSWLKLKPAHTLDLVVLAVEWGSGRRKGWLSNLHLGARSDDGFVMLGKTFKGLTDEVLKWQTDELLAREVRRDGHVVIVRPELVVEIAFNEVQASPRYPGGLALRFARVKGYRPDKRAEDADTIEMIRAIFERRVLPRV